MKINEVGFFQKLKAPAATHDVSQRIASDTSLIFKKWKQIQQTLTDQEKKNPTLYYQALMNFMKNPNVFGFMYDAPELKAPATIDDNAIMDYISKAVTDAVRQHQLGPLQALQDYQDDNEAEKTQQPAEPTTKKVDWTTNTWRDKTSKALPPGIHQTPKAAPKQVQTTAPSLANSTPEQDRERGKANRAAYDAKAAAQEDPVLQKQKSAPKELPANTNAPVSYQELEKAVAGLSKNEQRKLLGQLLQNSGVSVAGSS